MSRCEPGGSSIHPNVLVTKLHGNSSPELFVLFSPELCSTVCPVHPSLRNQIRDRRATRRRTAHPSTPVSLESRPARSRQAPVRDETLEPAIRSWACGHPTAGAFVARIVRVVVRWVVVSRITGRARGDPLLQFFYVQQHLFVHLVSPPFRFGINRRRWAQTHRQ